MARSPLDASSTAPHDYLRGFSELAQQIRDGRSFSGRERNCAFLNTGGTRFADVSAVTGLDFDDDARGLAVTDLDGDGDTDLVLSNRTAPLVRVVRNDAPPFSAGHVSLRLEGRKCNRDAIGARVEVQTDRNRLVQSLVAGDGFLSQSGKSLTFGLGQAESIDHVSVRWPGEPEVEIFTGVVRNASWILLQGTGRGMPLTRGALPALAPAMIAIPTETDSARIRLSHPLALPSAMLYQDLAGRTRRLEETWQGGPLLLNLWATWCKPCAAELKDLATLGNEVSLLPLSVEQLTDDPPAPDAAAINTFLRTHGISAAGGWATSELITALDHLIREAVYSHQVMPVPASFLIDQRGQVIVIYKGRITASQVRQDIAMINAPPEAARREAVPFPGRWARATAFASHPVAVARAFLESGEPGEAQAYLESWLAGQPSPTTDRTHRQFADVLALLAESIRPQTAGIAETKARDALRHLPGHIPATFELAHALAAQHKTLDARAALIPLRNSGPARLDALDLSADILLAEGRSVEAAAEWRAALALNSKFIPALHKLATLLATSPNETLRQPAEAAHLADFLLSAPNARQNPTFLAAAAAAHAAAGRFNSAATLQADALRRFGAAGDAAAVSTHARRLSSYRNSQPPGQ